MRITIANPDGYTVDETARAVGVSVHCLRIWKARLGWPIPRRAANGYLRYSHRDVAAITRVVHLLADGHRLNDLIVDGEPRWPSGGPSTAPPVAPDFARLLALPVPARELGARYQRLVRMAVMGRLSGHVQMLLIELACLAHPLDRELAGWLPVLHGLAAWDAARRPFPDADALRQFVRDQVGADAMAALLERVESA